MRIGVAQLNATVGDLDGNLALAIDAYEQLVGQGVDLVAYPELFLCGYPPRDLLLKTRFVSDLAERLNAFAEQTGSHPGGDRVRGEVGQGRRATFLQCSRMVRGGQGGPGSPQAIAADLRRIRRGPLLRAG